MHRMVTALAAAALALGPSMLAAQGATRALPHDSVHTIRRTPGPGRVAVRTKVDETVAATARISADSAESLALARVPEGGKVNSAELKMAGGKLAYEINVVPNGKKTVRKVYVNAVTGDVAADKQLGGLTGVVKKHDEHRKEVKARSRQP